MNMRRVRLHHHFWFTGALTRERTRPDASTRDRNWPDASTRERTRPGVSRSGVTALRATLLSSGLAALVAGCSSATPPTTAPAVVDGANGWRDPGEAHFSELVQLTD